jgi:hypothetical protein
VFPYVHLDPIAAHKIYIPKGAIRLPKNPLPALFPKLRSGPRKETEET